MDRRPAALHLADHLHDPVKQHLAANMLGPHDKAAGAIKRTAGEFITPGFFDRQEFAGHHRFINGGHAVNNYAINRHFFAWAHA